MMGVTDYAGYDYKKEFWDDVDRRYEDLCEKQTLASLFKAYRINDASVLDLGCGFGRLFDTYRSHGQSFTLLDYASNMLAQAKDRLGHRSDVRFIQGNALDLPLEASQFDLIVSIRTLHHLPDYRQFISELYRVARPGALVVFEIPNFRHILNIVRFLIGRQKNPFVKTVTPIRAGFVNFHPATIYKAVVDQGFSVLETRNVSFFRSKVFKRVISPDRLAAWDLCLQRVLSWMDLTPSIYVVCRKK